jgi:hypothetical protein
MAAVDRKRRCCIGGFLIATVLLLECNGLCILSAMNSPVSGRSVELKQAMWKWLLLKDEELQRKPALPEPESGTTVRLEKALHRKDDENEKPLAPSKDDVNARSGQKPDFLPHVSGIVQVIEREGIGEGGDESFAVIDGRKYGEKSIVRGFTVETIYPNSVVFSKGDRRWHVSIPEIEYYRIDTQGVP